VAKLPPTTFYFPKNSTKVGEGEILKIFLVFSFFTLVFEGGMKARVTPVILSFYDGMTAVTEKQH
jgi:hypothetical protein